MRRTENALGAAKILVRGYGGRRHIKEKSRKFFFSLRGYVFEEYNPESYRRNVRRFGGRRM